MVKYKSTSKQGQLEREGARLRQELQDLRRLVKSAVVDIEEMRGQSAYFGPFENSLGFSQGGGTEIQWHNLAIHCDKLNEALGLESEF